jgi:hypothetical protein
VTRPGLAKARALPFVVARSTVLLRASDATWRLLFDRADVMSEGSAREEASGRMWYGSTSLILPSPEPETEMLVHLAARDVHVRVRALRAARREACLRAPGRLGRLACEIRVARDPRGVRIDVDVQAPLIERRAASRPAR